VDCLTIIGNCFVDIAHHEISRTAVSVQSGRMRIKRQSFVETSQGLVEISFGAVSQGTSAMSWRETLVEAQRLVIIRDRPVKVAIRAKRFAAAKKSYSRFWPHGDSRRIPGDRLVKIASRKIKRCPL